MIRSIAKKYFAPHLKAQGFSKKGLVWNCRRGEFVDVITLQKATYSTSETQTITGNAGVFIPEFYEAIFGYTREAATEADCAVRARFGESYTSGIPGKGRDHWWDVTPNNIDAVGTELLVLLQGKVLPFLNTLSSYDAIEGHLSKVSDWHRMLPFDQLCFALVRWKNGDITGASEVLDVASRRWPEQAKRVQCWLRKSN
ncbi:MAG: DUF4304 domain-containing protein, partial [Planctomycetia bacterium]|nr:DUF4304 domain-containing protein [Planctomycetia bacterium]